MLDGFRSWLSTTIAPKRGPAGNPSAGVQDDYSAPTYTVSAQDADFGRDQVRAQAYAPPYVGPLQIDRYGNETGAMRVAYREFHAKEPSVRSAVEGKVNAIAALDISVQADDENSPEDGQAAEFIEYVLEHTPHGPDGLIRSILVPGVVDGWAVGEIVFAPVENHRKWGGLWGLRHLKALDTDHLRLVLDVYNNVSGVVNTVRGLATYPRDKFVLFTHADVYDNPFGRSDLRAAFRSAQLIDASYQVWHTALQLFAGGPLLLGKANTPSARPNLELALANARAAGYIVCSDKESVEILDFASAANYQAFQGHVEHHQRMIYLAVRGAYLPYLEGSGQNTTGDTSVTKNAATDPGEYVLAQAVCRAITQQLFAPLVRLNFGPDVGVPRLSLGGVNWAETGQQLDCAKRIAADFNLPVSKKWLYKVSSVPPPTGDDDTHLPPAAPPPGPPPQPPSPGGAAVAPAQPAGSQGSVGGLSAGMDFAGPPRPGLVAQTGDNEHPGHWVTPAEGANAAEIGGLKAKIVKVESYTTHRDALPDPTAIGAAKKLPTGKARKQVAKLANDALHEALASYMVRGGYKNGQEALDAMPEAQRRQYHAAYALLVPLHTGEERDPQLRTSAPLTPQRYAGYIRGVAKSVDEFRSALDGQDSGGNGPAGKRFAAFAAGIPADELTFAGSPPPGKVAQTGNNDKPGRWVNPPDAGGAAPKSSPADKKQAKADHAGRTAAAFSDPSKLTPESLGTLADDLGKMTVVQLKQLGAMSGVAGGRLKADRVAKLVADAKARTAPAKPGVPAPPPAPTPALAPTRAAMSAGDAKFGTHTIDSLPDFSNGYDAGAKSAAPAVRTKAAAAIQAFTPGERAAVVGYTGLEYEDTNAQMRKCPPAFGCLNDQAKGRADAIEAGIAKAGAFAEPVHVFRAVNMRTADGAATLLNAFRAAQSSGGDVTLPSIQSTSLAKKAAVNFGESGEHAVVYYIKAKTGLYADSISEGQGEQEVIKSAGSKYKVVNVASQPGKPHLVELMEV